jgi:hypothetical protein
MNEVFLGDRACQNRVSIQHFLSPTSGVDVMSSLYLYTQLLPEPRVLPVCGPLGSDGCAWWAVITPSACCLT